MKELTTLKNKFYNQKRRKKIISHVHVNLISRVYISIFMSVSNVWKSYSGSVKLHFMILQNQEPQGVLLKMVFLTVSQYPQESVGVFS